MVTLLVSSKGQIVFPAALRRRLGMGAGAAPVRGVERRLEDFDPAFLLMRSRRGKA